MEQQLIHYFATHPFQQALCLAAVGAALAGIRADWAKWQQQKATHPETPYDWWVATRSTLYAVATAVAPVVMSEVYKILGGVPQ